VTVGYKSNRLRKELSSASEIKRNFGANAKRLSSRLDDIASAPTLAILMQMPAANCHPLSGDRRGEWAVDVSANFRLIFEIDHAILPMVTDGVIDTKAVTNIRILEISDYH